MTSYRYIFKLGCEGAIVKKLGGISSLEPLIGRSEISDCSLVMVSQCEEHFRLPEFVIFFILLVGFCLLKV
jgi:hypothetical protein